MKNHIIISVLFFAIITTSCNYTNTELKKIETQLEKLESENTLLKDSISKLKEEDWSYKMLVGIPDGKFKVGKKNRIVFLLHSFKELPNYDVYKIEGDKEIKISTEKLSKFDYEFVPKSTSDNRVNLKIKIPNSDVEILNETSIPIE